jgi:hypothetical protein
MIGRVLILAGLASLTLAAKDVTFNRDVAPILFHRCVQCHHPNDVAPMSLMSYKEAKPWAAAIKEAVLLRKMPPWGADPHFGSWSNDARLSDVEIATLKAWAEGTREEGAAKDLPPAPTFTTGWQIGKPDVVFPIPEFKLTASGADEYSTVIVPTNFTEDKWVIAAELRPGNRKIVHHAHVFVISDEAPQAASKPAPDALYGQWLRVKEGTLQWIRPDAPVVDNGCLVDDNGVFPGTKQSPLGNMIGSYLPGRASDVYPEGTARRVPAGSKLRFQIHYSRATGKPETDITSVGLIFSSVPPQRIARRIDLSNHLFRIPPGDANHEVSECHTFDQDMYITSLTPHMHLRGKSMRFEATYPDGRKEALLDVPKYSFDWQITYRMAKPVFAPKGTRLSFVAHFDNSANNPRNPDPKAAVRWGSASENEMMDGWVEYLDAPLSGNPKQSFSASAR